MYPDDIIVVGKVFGDNIIFPNVKVYIQNVEKCDYLHQLFQDMGKRSVTQSDGR